MFAMGTRRSLAAAATLLFAAGCGGSSLVANGSRVPEGFRLIPGPQVAGPMLVPAVAPRHEPGYILASAKTKPILFVAWIDANVIYLYDANTPNPTPIGSITAGLDHPAGLAVDAKGTLYVANISNNTITEYLAGQTKVHFTINSGTNGPYGIGVDSKNNVFVSNVNDGSLSGFHAGKTKPFETIPKSAFGPYSQVLGIAIDSHDNVWTASDSDNRVYEIPAGSATPQNAGLTGLSGPIGVAFAAKNTLYVTDYPLNQVGIYPAGQTQPSGTLTNGINAPTLNGFTKGQTFFQAEQSGSVEGYKLGQTSPFSSITYSGRPLGIASSPKLIP